MTGPNSDTHGPRAHRMEKMMNVGDLIEYRCPKFGLVTQWRVVAVCLGAERQESLIGLEPVTNSPGCGTSGPVMQTVWVPEQLTRGLNIAFRQEGDA